MSRQGAPGRRTHKIAQNPQNAIDRSPLVFDRRAALAPVWQKGVENLPFRVRHIAPTHVCLPKKGKFVAKLSEMREIENVLNWRTHQCREQ
jgi:hypothetical protein